MYEVFEHTADLGLRAQAADRETLFAEAAACLFSAILEDIGTVQPESAVTVEVSGTDQEYLLFDWLKELLYQFDAEHRVFSRFEARIREDGLTGMAWGEAFDPARHLLGHEVKAITYHGLKVEQSAGEWLAEVIVDI